MKGNLANLPFGPIIPLLRIHPDIIIYVTFICDACYTVYRWERSETIYLSISHVLLNELWYALPVEYYVGIKRNEKTLYTCMVLSQRNIIKWKKKKNPQFRTVCMICCHVKREKHIRTFCLICRKQIFLWKIQRKTAMPSPDLLRESVQLLALRFTEVW